jgi:hypothetical protein
MSHDDCPYANKVGMVDCPQATGNPAAGHAYHRCVVDTLSKATVGQAPVEPECRPEPVAQGRTAIQEPNDTGPPLDRLYLPDRLSRSPLRRLAFWSALHNKQDIPDRPSGAVPRRV